VYFGDDFDVGYTELDTFVPGRVAVQVRFKAKTTKTP
jgi:hypothetical protein